MKAPARWSGHEQNTDSLSLKSSTIPHAALGRAGSPVPTNKKPYYLAKSQARMPGSEKPRVSDTKLSQRRGEGDGGCRPWQESVGRTVSLTFTGLSQWTGSASAAALSPWGAQFQGDSTSHPSSCSDFPQMAACPSRNQGDDPSKPPRPRTLALSHATQTQVALVPRLDGSKGLPV